MASLPRSSIRNIVTKHRNLPRHVVRSIATSSHDPTGRDFSTAVIPSQTLPQRNESYISNPQIKKVTQTDLIQALDNLVHVRKSLEISNAFPPAVQTDTLDDVPAIATWQKSLDEAVKKSDMKTAVKLFYSAPDDITENVTMCASLIKSLASLFFHLHPRDYLVAMFDVHCTIENLYSVAQENCHGKKMHTIKKTRHAVLDRVITNFGRAHTGAVPVYKWVEILSDVSCTIHCITDARFQHELYPKLMNLLLDKYMSRIVARSKDLAEIEKEIWDCAICSFEMMENFSREDNIKAFKAYERVLSMSTFRKQKTLPFASLMNTLVDRGSTPRADSVLRIIQNEFPFTNINISQGMLQSLLHLQKNKEELFEDYIIDVGTLEHIALFASKKGSSRTMTVILDYMQEIRKAGYHNYEPTECIYECAAHAFAASNLKQDQLVFGVLSTMEDQGYKPSHVFLKSLARAMKCRSVVGRLHNFFHILQNSHEAEQYGNNNEGVGPRVTTAALNTIIAGYSYQGLIDKTFQTYKAFERFNCEPDENTFTFMLETVAANLRTAIPSGFDVEGDEWVSAQEETADALIEEIFQRGYQLTKPMIHAYVQALCASGNLSKARNFLADMALDAEENGKSPSIELETFSNLALSFAINGELDNADEIAQLSWSSGYVNGLPNYAVRRIERIRDTQSS